MHNYTAIVSAHISGSIIQESLAALCDRRNSVQHALLSLPEISSSGSSNPDISLYGPTRLAAQIYALLVTFPLPANTAPFAALASRLQTLLSALQITNRSRAELDLVLWMLAMGGVAAVGERALRAWFVVTIGAFERMIGAKRSDASRERSGASWERRGEVEEARGFREWSAVRCVLEKFLWLDSTNAGDGEKLWGEVLRAEEKQVGKNTVV